MSERRFATITTAIVVLSYIAAMTVSSLEKVLAYVGSTGSTTISFILPGLFYYKISSPDSPHHQRLMKEDDDEEVTEGDETSSEFRTRDPDYISTVRLRSKIVRNASMALAIYGFVVMITCLITNTFFVVAH